MMSSAQAQSSWYSVSVDAVPGDAVSNVVTAYPKTRETAAEWLSKYMLEGDVDSIVDYFSSYDDHKSHSRPISRNKARDLGLKVLFIEDAEAGLADLVRSLYNQIRFFFDHTAFYKLFENSHGVSWGPRVAEIVIPKLDE